MAVGCAASEASSRAVVVAIRRVVCVSVMFLVLFDRLGILWIASPSSP